ncbi:phage portal protein [Tepidanaerobacter syntrophicus]|uniref:phage portal protein n=1 Tax=Tepidanaerobacter syntrophicus TaxID=224999 RepID=UPI001BD6A9B3|nr:phage portal protein [Tepidanaerobacter syntrophicus]
MAKERRSLFNMIFGRTKQPAQEYTNLKMLSGYQPVFTMFGDNAYASDIVRSAVDAIARNGAKLKPKHIRKANGDIMQQNSSIQYLLDTRPNKYMDSYTFFYRVLTELFMRNNSFVFIDKDDAGTPIGLYPISSANLELLESKNDIYARFKFYSGEQITVPYGNIIHLRRFYYDNDFYGASNKALIPTLELINTTNEGIINAIKTSANMRGILKFTQAMLKPEDIKKERDRFVAEYMNIDNNGGIGAIDAKADFIPLDNKPQIIDKDTMAHIKQSVYDYFGVSEPIITSNYTEEQWNAFYESTLEPIAVQMGLEFTAKLFTDREIGFGNQIIFESSRLQYASATTKSNLITNLMGLAVLSVNEAREILNLAPVEGGDIRYQSLNFINAVRATDYQLQNEGGGNDASNTETQNTNQ